MANNDDEPIVPPPNVSGRTNPKIIKKPKAALEETELKVLLELLGSGDNEVYKEIGSMGAYLKPPPLEAKEESIVDLIAKRISGRIAQGIDERVEKEGIAKEERIAKERIAKEERIADFIAERIVQRIETERVAKEESLADLIAERVAKSIEKERIAKEECIDDELLTNAVIKEPTVEHPRPITELLIYFFTIAIQALKFLYDKLKSNPTYFNVACICIASFISIFILPFALRTCFDK